MLSCKHPENITHSIPEPFKKSLRKKKKKYGLDLGKKNASRLTGGWAGFVSF